MGKVYISLIKKHCRVSIARSSAEAVLFITNWDFFNPNKTGLFEGRFFWWWSI